MTQLVWQETIIPSRNLTDPAVKSSSGQMLLRQHHGSGMDGIMGLSGNPALQNKLYGLYPSNLQPKSSFLTDGLMSVINVESPRIFSIYNLNQ